MVPRQLFQVFPTRQLPPSLSSVVAANLLNAQGWRYQCFCHDDILQFISEHYGERMLRYYLAIAVDYGAARADFFRYLLIYALGGVYLDIKSQATRPLSEVVLPDDEFLLGQWHDCGEAKYRQWGEHRQTRQYGGEFQQWFIAASPKHPFLGAVIERVCRNIDSYLPALHGIGKIGVLQLTGPIAYTKAIGSIIHEAPHRRVRSYTDLGLIYTAFENHEQHFSLFKTHYSTLATSVVRIGPVRRLLNSAIHGALRLASPVTRRFRAGQ